MYFVIIDYNGGGETLPVKSSEWESSVVSYAQTSNGRPQHIQDVHSYRFVMRLCCTIVIYCWFQRTGK